MFGDGTRVENAITYLQDLDGQLGQADDIYQVRDEVRLVILNGVTLLPRDNNTPVAHIYKKTT